MNPAIIFFSVTLTALNSTCKSVNSGDFVNKLLKQKSKVQSIVIDLDFGGGKYFASLRLARGHRGILEVMLILHFTLFSKNKVHISLLDINLPWLWDQICQQLRLRNYLHYASCRKPDAF